MGVKFGNEWSPNGDYGTEFKDELQRMINILEDAISRLKSYKNTLNSNSDNTKLTEPSIEQVDYVINKLLHTIDDLKLEKSCIRTYNN